MTKNVIPKSLFSFPLSVVMVFELLENATPLSEIQTCYENLFTLILSDFLSTTGFFPPAPSVRPRLDEHRFNRKNI